MVTAQALLLALAITGSNETVLLDFSAAWCGPCRTMEPIVHRLSSAGYPVRKIDVDQNPEMASRFRVTGLPCFVMLVNGQEVDRVVGAASHGRLAQMFEQAQVAPGRAQVRGQSPDNMPPAAFSSQPPGRPSAVAPPQQPSGSASPVNQAMAATVRIKVEDPQGHGFATGTVIDSHGSEALVVTCGHVFRDSQGKGRITVETFAGGAPQGSEGFLVSFDLKRDIALVSFRPGLKIAPAPVAVSGTGIRPGVGVFSIGCDRGAAPSVRQSNITSVDKYRGPPNIEVAGEPVVGRSGGGLFTTNGELIGICNYADPQDNEGIYASLATIHWELDRIGQRRIYQRESVAVAQNQAPSQSPAAHRSAPAAVPRNAAPQTPPTTNVAALGQQVPADTEVICIVRSRSNPNGPNEVIVLDQPSQSFLKQLRSGSSGLVPVEIAGRPRRNPVVRAQSADR